MANRGRLFVISGPAGAGKSEIVKQVLKKHPDVKLSVSCTTRDPRPNEIDGVHYHFVTEEKFKQLVSEDAFYEWAHVHQNHYGTLKSTVREELEAGRPNRWPTLTAGIALGTCSEVELRRLVELFADVGARLGPSGA